MADLESTLTPTRGLPPCHFTLRSTRMNRQHPTAPTAMHHQVHAGHPCSLLTMSGRVVSSNATDRAAVPRRSRRVALSPATAGSSLRAAK